jgi:hypothetical protein
MTASTFVTYLWHYMTARLIYDDFLRPLTHGHPRAIVPVVVVALLAFAAGRLTRRRA